MEYNKIMEMLFDINFLKWCISLTDDFYFDNWAVIRYEKQPGINYCFLPGEKSDLSKEVYISFEAFIGQVIDGYNEKYQYDIRFSHWIKRENRDIKYFFNTTFGIQELYYFDYALNKPIRKQIQAAIHCLHEIYLMEKENENNISV